MTPQTLETIAALLAKVNPQAIIQFIDQQVISPAQEDAHEIMTALVTARKELVALIEGKTETSEISETVSEPVIEPVVEPVVETPVEEVAPESADAPVNG